MTGEKRAIAVAGYATLALPAVAVFTVGYAVLVAGKPRPVQAARIRGGPTEGASVLSFRVEGVARGADGERALAHAPVNVDVTLSTGATIHWNGELDDEGAAEVLVRPTGVVTGPVRYRVTRPPRGAEASSAVLVDDVVSVTADRWSGGARRRGGWVEKHRGAAPDTVLDVRVAAGRGAFAVPFRDPLVVDVRKGGAPVSGARVRARSESADVDPADIVTDSRGRGTLFVRPREHAASITVHAHAPSGEDAELEVALAVVPGALHAALSDGTLVVESPIARERAYVTIVGEGGRLAGRAMKLADDGRGGARSSASLGELGAASSPPDRPIWAVVSSEPDQRSSALVGWPLSQGPIDEPRSTFDVPDALLADGISGAVARESRRVGRVRLAAALVAVAALSLAGALVVWRARRSERDLAAHLGENLPDAETTTRLVDSSGARMWVLVAVSCFALGAVLIAVFALWR